MYQSNVITYCNTYQHGSHTKQIDEDRMDEYGDPGERLRKEHPQAYHGWLSQYQCENQPQSVHLPAFEGGQHSRERGVSLQEIFRKGNPNHVRKISEKDSRSPQTLSTSISNQISQEGRYYPYRAYGQDAGAEAPRNLRVHSPGLLRNDSPGLCGANQETRTRILYASSDEEIIHSSYKSICESICGENHPVCPHPPLHPRCHPPSPRIHREKSASPQIRGYDVVPASEAVVYHHETDPRNPQIGSLHCADGYGEDIVSPRPLRRISRHFHLCSAPCGSGSGEICDFNG